MNTETISQLAKIESVPFDFKNFEDALNKAKEKSRYEADKPDDEVISNYSLQLLESRNVPKTDDSLKYNFKYTSKGYDFPILKCKLLGMVLNGNSFLT